MADSEPDVAQLPDDLPPVQPPSAGFIVQLFVVPGLIVAAIVGVWLLFGKLAAPDTDWRNQMAELQNPNEHRRWRGALGLAQMLKADRGQGDQGERLAQNRELAQTLADVLNRELTSGSAVNEEHNYQAFLARTLGLFDLPDVVQPALEAALRPGNDREVRKNALASIAVMSDRMSNFPSAAYLAAVTQASFDDDALIRRLSAYTLGLWPVASAQDRLEVMLQDSDADTRINAAIGLARQGDSRGTGVLSEVLKQAAMPAKRGSAEEFEQFLAMRNALAAAERLGPKLSDDERRELTKLIEPLAQSHGETRIRVSAQQALAALRGK
ncbi:MAG: HEAT repeat domain-containing protein [Planctomycetaceae bacterium]